jgi:phage protein D
MAETTPFLGVTLDGADRDLAPLARLVEIEDNDRLVDEARLTFADPDGNAAALFQPGKKLKLDLGWAAEHAVLFEGVLVECRPQAGATGTRSVTAVARDLSHAMSTTAVTEEHPAGPLATIVERIAARNGWSGDKASIVCDPNPTLSEHNARTQHHKSDYAFLQELAERYGARAFVEYNDGKSKFYFVSNRGLLQAKALGRLEYCRGLNKLIEFSYETIAPRAARQVVASAVDPVSGEVRTTQGEAPAGATAPSTPVAGAPSPPPATPPAPVAAPGQPSDPDRAERATVVDPTRVLGLRGKGRAVGTIMLRAKGKVEIAGIAPWAEGDWYVSKAVHTWRDTSTREVKGSSYETVFTATR